MSRRVCTYVQDTAVLTNQICSIRDAKYLKFPATKNRLNLGPLPEEVRLKEVRIKPCHGSFTVEAILECPENANKKQGKLCGLEEESLKKTLASTEAGEYRVAAIDPGVNNFCAVTTNFGAKPFLISGRVIKSENHYYNKKLAKFRVEAERCNKKKSAARIRRLTDRRNRIIKDQMHKASRKVTDWAAENRVDVVVLGHNHFQKQNISLGNVNNQNFVQIPYCVFADMLRYKLTEKGIAFLETEESYTSKADYLAGDELPVYDRNRKSHEYPALSGKRICLGLYRHADGSISNADINGAANILRKVFPNVREWDRGAVDAPYVVRIA